MRSISVVVCGILCFIASLQSFSAEALPSKTIPHPFGVQLKKPDCTAETLKDIRSVGFRVVRRGFIWHEVEKEQGVYDFSAYDALLEEVRKNGLRMLGCIALGNNKLYGPVGKAPGREAYAKYAAELVKRYKDHNIIWELWNEPNTMTFWGKHGKGNSDPYAEEYVALVKEAVAAMRKEDPNCYILAGSVSCLWSESFKWTEYCFKRKIHEAGFNAWSMHPYGFKTPEEYFPAYAKVREILDKHGAPKDLPFLDSERGYSVKASGAEGFSGGPESMVHQYQAWHLVRQYIVDQLCGMKLTIWYEWSGDEFGLRKGKETRPAYNAAKVMFEQLDGFELSKRVPLASESDFQVLYEKATGEQKLVVWTAPPSGQSPDKAVAHEIEIDVPGGGAIDVFDLYGKKSSVAVANGKIKISLSGSPQYVVLRGAAAK